MEGSSELGDVHLPPTLTNDELSKAAADIQTFSNALRIGTYRGRESVRVAVKEALAI